MKRLIVLLIFLFKICRNYWKLGDIFAAEYYSFLIENTIQIYYMIYYVHIFAFIYIYLHLLHLVVTFCFSFPWRQVFNNYRYQQFYSSVPFRQLISIDVFSFCISSCFLGPFVFLSFIVSFFYFFCLFVFLSFCRPVFLSRCLSVYLSFCLSFFLSIFLFLYLYFFCLFVSYFCIYFAYYDFVLRSFYLFVFLSLRLSLCRSFCRSIVLLFLSILFLCLPTVFLTPFLWLCFQYTLYCLHRPYWLLSS